MLSTADSLISEHCRLERAVYHMKTCHTIHTYYVQIIEHSAEIPLTVIDAVLSFSVLHVAVELFASIKETKLMIVACTS